MKYLKLVLIGGYVLTLIGCASGSKMENMVYDGSQAKQNAYDVALKKEISVKSVLGGQKTNPAWTSQIGNEEFKEALKRSLAEQGLLSESGNYNLSVNLLNIDQPFFGLDMTVTTTIRYIIKESKNNNIIFDKKIKAPYTATMSDAFLGITRLRLANEGSARTNIEWFLTELSRLNISLKNVSIND